MYASPVIKRMRAAVEEATTDEEFTGRLIEAIETDPAVQAAIRKLLRPPAAKPAAPRGKERR